MLVDTHAHIELQEFEKDREGVLERAKKAGIKAILTVGIDLDDSKKAVGLAERYSMVYAAVGVHPHDASGITPETYEELKTLARAEKVVAYGEIGLDFFRNRSPKDMQIKRFGEQLDLSVELGLPVIIHDRDAHKEIMDMIECYKGKLTGVVHCFSGDYEMACRCLDLGYYISVPGTVTYKNSVMLRDVVRKIPLERLLVETDAPFLAPEPKRGKRNESSFITYTAGKIAEIRGVPYEVVATRTTQNAGDLFGI
ncbi:MAG: TatD family hydrolase [Syntrophales bacterium]|jgi:TatD DNase family protein|nr:TatD family hydrolase [Syntrophales bacterium]MDY0044974.1 TatD family hydrolase [Syntrophales bacterium]